MALSREEIISNEDFCKWLVKSVSEQLPDEDIRAAWALFLSGVTPDQLRAFAFLNKFKGNTSEN